MNWEPDRRKLSDFRVLGSLLPCVVLLVGGLLPVTAANGQSFPPADPCASSPPNACADMSGWEPYWDEVVLALSPNYWGDLRVAVDYLQLDLPGSRFHIEGTVDTEGFTENDVVAIALNIHAEALNVSVRLCDYGQVRRFEGVPGSCLEFFEVDLNADRFRAWGTHTMDPSPWMSYSPPRPSELPASVTMTTGPAETCSEFGIEVFIGTSTVMADQDGGVITFVGSAAPPEVGGETIEAAPISSLVPVEQTVWNDYAKPGYLLVAFKQLDSTVQTSLANVGAELVDLDDEEPSTSLVLASVTPGTEVATMEMLVQDPNVDSVLPDLYVVPHWEPNDVYYIADQVEYLGPWPRDPITNRVTTVLGTLDMDQAWEGGGVPREGLGVTVAVVDSGVDFAHTDLDDNLIPGGDIIGSGLPQDSDGHGTNVAGIIAAEANFSWQQGSNEGIAGTAPKATIMPVRVFRTHPLDDLQDCIMNPLNCGGWREWHKGVRHARYNGADIINMSLGFPLVDSLVESWYRKTRWHRRLKRQVRLAYEEEGIFLVASSGNDGLVGWPNDRPNYPARHAWVEAVGATFHDPVAGTWGWADFSNVGVDLVAPGDFITSTQLNGGVARGLGGTSFASPHVAGVAALMIDRIPGIHNFEIREELRRTAEPMGAPGNDSPTGAGLLNAARAVGPAPFVPVGTVDIVAVPGPSGVGNRGWRGPIFYSPVKRFTAAGGLLSSFDSSVPGGWGTEVAAGNLDPSDSADEVVVAGVYGSPGTVSIYKVDGTLSASLPPVSASSSIHRRVAVGNVLKGQDLEVIVGEGPGGNNTVEVWADISGVGWTRMWMFNAFSGTTLDGEGVFVAAGDLDGDLEDELIVGAGPRNTMTRFVEVYDTTEWPGWLGETPPPGLPANTVGLDPTNPYGFRPWDVTHVGVPLSENAFDSPASVIVAAGDTDGDGRDEIIVGAGQSSSPEVRVFEFEDPASDPSLGLPTLRRKHRFHGHDPIAWSGVRVAAGDLDNDGVAEIVVSSDHGGGVHIRAFEEDGRRLFTRFSAFVPMFQSGVRVAVGSFQ